jgi:hypothetical protein
MSFEPTPHYPATNPYSGDSELDALAPEPLCEALFRALIDAGSDLAQLAPELSGCRTLAYRYSLPPGLIGAYVPVFGLASGFHVGVLADVCSCDMLTGALNRARDPGEPGVRPALSAFAHELGLSVVRRVAPDLQLTVGPALFVDGLVRRTRRARLRAADVAFGSINATLALVSLEALRDTDWPGRNSGSSEPKERR